jgi:CHAD domain-containing protein
MKDDKIINLFNNSLKKAHRHYNNLLEDFELEEIHDFRLQIKKLRAFIRLVNTEAAKEKSIKISKEIKTFYHTVGSIRNVQLHKQRIIQWCIALSFSAPATYLELLSEEEARGKNTARAEAEEISFSHFKKNLVASVPDELTAPCIQYFTILKRKELLALLSLSVYNDETLHNIRKVLKDILYDWNYITPYLASVLPKYFLDKKNIESLATKLGDFHDLCVAICFFTPTYIDQVISEAENGILTIIKRRIEWEKYNLKEQIVSLFQSIKKDIWVENIIRDVCEIR